jgi:hypothetical protein
VQETPSAEFGVKRGVQTEYEAAGTKMQALWPEFGHNAHQCSRERLSSRRAKTRAEPSLLRRPTASITQKTQAIDR